MSNVYIFPCNPEFFNIEDNLSGTQNIIWRKPSGIMCGDSVFVYVGKTIKEILYKFEVVNIDVSKEVLAQNTYAIPKGKIAQKCTYLEMKLLKKYDIGTYHLSELKANGMGQFMVPMMAPANLKHYLENKDALWEENKNG